MTPLRTFIGRIPAALIAGLLLAGIVPFRAAAQTSTPVWQFLGPQPLQSFADGLVAGRIAAIAVDPSRSGSAFAAGMGGVWQTTDDGLTWQPLTSAIPLGAAGALAFDPLQPDVLYAGTGDPNGAQESRSGIGLLRSSDDGQTWTVLGAAVFAGMAVSRIAVDPANSSHLLVAAVTAQESPSGVQPGLYASTDGGQTWAMPQGLPVAEAWDFAWDSAHSTVIAAIGTHLYRSSDNGASFALLSGSPIPSVITRAALCPLPGTAGFLLVTADAQFNLGALLKTTDDGQTWSSLTGPPGLFGSFGSGQGFYDIAIAADPATPNHWWLGGNDVWETKDGGNTWTDLVTAAIIHPDQHALLAVAGQLWIGNDGGVWREDATGQVHNLNSGLGNLGVLSLVASLTLPDLWTTTLGDGLDHRGAAGSIWQIEQMGGGGTLALSPASSQQVYFIAPQLTGIEVSNDGGLTFTNPIPSTAATANTPLADSAKAPWLVPLAVDPQQSNTLYCGSWRIWKSTDAGVSWTELAGSETTGVIVALTISPAGPSHVYAATSLGGILASSDGGATWAAASTSGLPPRPLTDLRAAYDSTQHLWAAIGGRNSVAPAGHVFVSTDGGATWSPRSSGLPDAPVQRLLLDPFDFNVVFAALPSGVYATTDGGQSWALLGSGLPAIPVTDLQIDAAGDLLVATLGRGVWMLPMATLTRKINAFSGSGQSGAADSVLSQPLVAQVTNGSGTPVAGSTVLWSDGGAGGSFSSSSSTTDSQGNASVQYTLPKKSRALSISASAGAATASFTETANAGPATLLQSIGGNQQSAVAGTQLPQSLSVRVLDAFGNGVPNLPVAFSDGDAGGKFAADTVMTGATGLASDGYTLPSTPGAVTVTAASAGLISVTFSLTATAPPDFQWQTASSSLQVAQNAVLTVPIQTTAIGGDTAPIRMLCLQPATGCSFAPNPVAPGSSATLTLNAGSLAAGMANAVVVQGSDGVHTHQLQLSVNVVAPPGLLLASDPGQMTLTNGGQGAFTLTLTPQGGLSGPVQLSVAGANGAALPTGMSVAFAPSAPALAGAAVSSTLTITTTSRVLAAASPSLAWLRHPLGFAVPLFGVLLLLAFTATPRRWPALVLGLLLLTAAACGGGGAAPAYQAPRPTVNPNGTPAGTYPLVVTATCSSISVSATITVTVN